MPRLRAEATNIGGLSRQFRFSLQFRLARLGAAFYLAGGDALDHQKMLRDGDALDQGRLFDRTHFLKRKRRLLANRFRNKRRRIGGLWKHAEFARYLPERLLLVGPVQCRVIETLDDGGLDDLEIRRDVEIPRHVQRRVADM